jgi:hypothetical protein
MKNSELALSVIFNVCPLVISYGKPLMIVGSKSMDQLHHYQWAPYLSTVYVYGGTPPETLEIVIWPSELVVVEVFLVAAKPIGVDFQL